MKFFLLRERNLPFLAFSSTYLTVLLLKCTTFVTDFIERMDENKTYLRGYAMQYGTCMGLFWIFKFAFFPLGLKMPLLELLFMVLTIAVPVLGYVYARRFRDRYCGGYLSFFRALAFCFLMYMFASILTAVAHYIYFEYIDNGFIFNAYEQVLQQAGQMQGMERLAKQMSEVLDAFRKLSTIQLTMQLISQNIFYGSLLAFPTALLVMRRKVPVY